MVIPLFPGMVYATKDSQETGNMTAGFYRYDNVTAGFYKVGRDGEGASSNSAEHAAACITLEDALKYLCNCRPFILLTDSKCLLMAIQYWISQGMDSDPTMENM